MVKNSFALKTCSCGVQHLEEKLVRCTVGLDIATVLLARAFDLL